MRNSFLHRQCLLFLVGLLVLLFPQLTFAACEGPTYVTTVVTFADGTVGTQGSWQSLYSTKAGDNQNLIPLDPEDPLCMAPNDPLGPQCPKKVNISTASATGCQASGYNQHSKLFITGTLCQIQESIADATFHIFCALQHAMRNILIAMFTIYIALYFIALILKMTSMREGWHRLLKGIFILGIVANPEIFYELIYRNAFAAINGFSELMMQMMPARDMNGKLVYTCPDGVANIGQSPPGCTPIMDCVDINIINPVPTVVPDPPPEGVDIDSFGGYLLRDPTTDELIQDPSVPVTLNPAVDALGWRINSSVNKPCRYGNQNNCILDCGEKGAPMFEPAILLEECGGSDPDPIAIMTTCDPEILANYGCAMKNNVPACWPVPREPVPNRSVFESYDILFEQLIGYDFLRSVVAFMIATMLAFFGIGILIALLSFVGITAAFWAFIRLFETFLRSILALSFTLVLAPIFIPFAFFKVTFPLFQRWVATIIGYVLQPVLILAFMLLTAELTDITNFESGLGTRGVYIVMDTYSFLGKDNVMINFLNLDLTFQGPKFSLTKKQEGKGDRWSQIPFNTNIRELPYADFVKRIAVLESGTYYTSQNTQMYTGLFQMGEPYLSGINYMCGGSNPPCWGGSPAKKDLVTCACIEASGDPNCCKMKWAQPWTGWLGICSIEDFQNNPDAQVIAMLLGTIGNVNAVSAFASNYTGLKMWDADTHQPYACQGQIYSVDVKEPRINAAMLVGAAHGAGAGGVSDLLAAGIEKCPLYLNACEHCESVYGTGNATCNDFCTMDLESALAASGTDCRGITPTTGEGPVGCDPYGDPVADCVLFIDKKTDGLHSDLRDRMCELHNMSDNVMQLTSRATMWATLKSIDGVPIPDPANYPTASSQCGGTAAVAGQTPPKNGRPNVNNPPSDPDALNKIFAAVVAFTLAWVLVGKITTAFLRKMPEIARELSSWTGARTMPIIGGAGGDLGQVVGGIGNNPSMPIASAVGQVGKSSFYTLESSGAAIFSGISGVARGRAGKGHMGYTHDGKRASQEKGGVYKRRAMNQFGIGRFFGAGEGGGGVSGFVGRKGSSRVRREVEIAKGYAKDREARATQNSVSRRSSGMFDFFQYRKDVLKGSSKKADADTPLGKRPDGDKGGNSPWG